MRRYRARIFSFFRGGPVVGPTPPVVGKGGFMIAIVVGVVEAMHSGMRNGMLVRVSSRMMILILLMALDMDRGKLRN